MGTILRERRMTAGVGRTLPDGCRNAIDEACRRLLQSKSEHKARLLTAGARCLSACVYALVGASVRQVARDAQLGIHSARILPIPGRTASGPLPTVDDLHRLLKRYVLEMGIDPGLIDAAAKISADSVRFLTRDEITRFGIEFRDSYETPWMRYQSDGSGQQNVFKSITQAGGASGREHRTSTIHLWCTGSGYGLSFAYRREIPEKEDAPPVIRVAAGESEYVLKDARTRTSRAPNWSKAQEVLSRFVVASREPAPGNERRSTLASLDFLRNAMAVPSIVITEEPTGEGAGPARVIKLSTNGLGKALEPLLQECGAPPKFLDAPAVKFLDGAGADRRPNAR
jgi:hypothetical protein